MTGIDLQNLYNRWKFLENDYLKKNRLIHLLKRIGSLEQIINDKGDEIKIFGNKVTLRINVSKELESSKFEVSELFQKASIKMNEPELKKLKQEILIFIQTLEDKDAHIRSLKIKKEDGAELLNKNEVISNIDCLKVDEDSSGASRLSENTNNSNVKNIETTTRNFKKNTLFKDRSMIRSQTEEEEEKLKEELKGEMILNASQMLDAVKNQREKIKTDNQLLKNIEKEQDEGLDQVRKGLKKIDRILQSPHLSCMRLVLMIVSSTVIFFFCMLIIMIF